MELPAKVRIHNQSLGIKGGKGTLVAVHDKGFYEVKIVFGENKHRVFLPIGETVIILREPEVDLSAELEIER